MYIIPRVLLVNDSGLVSENLGNNIGFRGWVFSFLNHFHHQWFVMLFYLLGSCFYDQSLSEISRQ